MSGSDGNLSGVHLLRLAVVFDVCEQGMIHLHLLLEFQIFLIMQHILRHLYI